LDRGRHGRRRDDIAQGTGIVVKSTQSVFKKSGAQEGKKLLTGLKGRGGGLAVDLKVKWIAYRYCAQGGRRVTEARFC